MPVRKGTSENSVDDEDLIFPIQLTSSENLQGLEFPQLDEKRKQIHKHWKKALAKAKNLKDPWQSLHFENYPEEYVIRHRYNAIKKTWVVDYIFVKMEVESFAHGAMRECFRLKKKSSSRYLEWNHDSNNFVAKRYITTVKREVYFEDVKLQMNAKLWGEEYNRHNPPKKVDIFQLAVIEFPNRDGSPIFHIEHFIQGRYRKYNSNSGFINDDNYRNTPQAFSHFTFEHSGHELIVVDIQGVGDLYTDPQIHTVNGEEYGEGNLGIRGMALFFHSHACNDICHNLGLNLFDLAPSEIHCQNEHNREQNYSDGTVCRSFEICFSPFDFDHMHRSFSVNHCNDYRFIHNSPNSSPLSKARFDSGCSVTSLDDFESEESDHISSDSDVFLRHRYISEGSLSVICETDHKMFSLEMAKKHRSSCFGQNLSKGEYNILGRIHLEVARYYEIGRFSGGNEDYDKEAALFHLQHAADSNIVEAILAYAQLLLQLDHDILVSVKVPQSQENYIKGIHYMKEAAELGERLAMVFLAKVYDDGLIIDGNEVLTKDWTKSIYWYEEAVNMSIDDSENGGGIMDDASYYLVARQAEMFEKGGYGLEPNFQKAAELFEAAAELATSMFKGRLATKYYYQAEVLRAKLPEE